MNLKAWFERVYPWKEARANVVLQYRALADTHRLVLRDIALRGGVYSVDPADRSLYQAGVAEGRRQLALEILNTCAADPAQLIGTVDAKKPGER